MGLVLQRAFNKNQLLILFNIKGHESITPLLSRVSERNSIALSTLRLNAKILKSLGIIEFNDSPARLSSFGLVLYEILKSGKYGEKNKSDRDQS